MSLTVIVQQSVASALYKTRNWNAGPGLACAPHYLQYNRSRSSSFPADLGMSFLTAERSNCCSARGGGVAGGTPRTKNAKKNYSYSHRKRRESCLNCYFLRIYLFFGYAPLLKSCREMGPFLGGGRQCTVSSTGRLIKKLGCWPTKDGFLV